MICNDSEIANTNEPMQDNGNEDDIPTVITKSQEYRRFNLNQNSIISMMN